LAETPERHVRRVVHANTMAEIRRRSERAFVKPADEKVLGAGAGASVAARQLA